jgi:hypothetical protein
MKTYLMLLVLCVACDSPAASGPYPVKVVTPTSKKMAATTASTAHGVDWFQATIRNGDVNGAFNTTIYTRHTVVGTDIELQNGLLDLDKECTKVRWQATSTPGLTVVGSTVYTTSGKNDDLCVALDKLKAAFADLLKKAAKSGKLDLKM